MTTSILDQFKLTGQTALVVGGNRGLGIEMSKALAEGGANNIVVAARDAARNQQACDRLAADYKCECLASECDATDPEQVAATVAAAVERFGKIDVLVNSAGINVRGPIDAIEPKDFEQVMKVNVTGTWLTCREVVPVMKRNGYGRILNVSSMLGAVAMADRTPYATSKGAVLQLTRALALEVATEKITVNALMPGPFATEMNLPLTNDPEKYNAFIAQIPMGRWGELHEVAALRMYLCSPASSYVTGSGFLIDGGWTAR